MRRECRERFPRQLLQRKPLVNDQGMHHDTCVTHVPWCMSRLLPRGGGENVPGACTNRNCTYLEDSHGRIRGGESGKGLASNGCFVHMRRWLNKLVNIIYVWLIFKKKTTPHEMAHTFCLYLLRAKDEAFDVFLGALRQREIGQEHIAEELEDIKEKGWVSTGDHGEILQLQKVSCIFMGIIATSHF